MKIKRLGKPAVFYNQTIEDAQENLDRLYKAHEEELKPKEVNILEEKGERCR